MNMFHKLHWQLLFQRFLQLICSNFLEWLRSSFVLVRQWLVLPICFRVTPLTQLGQSCEIYGYIHHVNRIRTIISPQGKDNRGVCVLSWWRHQMETFSALLAICVGIHRSPVNSPHKGQWRGAFMFSLICAWINDWMNNGEAGDLRRHRAHYDVTVMMVGCQNS